VDERRMSDVSESRSSSSSAFLAEDKPAALEVGKSERISSSSVGVLSVEIGARPRRFRATYVQHAISVNSNYRY
jgi:hypothetical protein